MPKTGGGLMPGLLPGVIAAAVFTVSAGFAADCTFIANRDEILNRAQRDRQQISGVVRRLSHGPALAEPVAPDKIPQRNFIDQEILGKLAAAGMTAAPLSSDEEF